MPENDSMDIEQDRENERIIATQEEPILKYFAYKHLPEKLQGTSQRFMGLALHIVADIPRSAERTVALRKLLESKDAAVRARL